MQKFIFSSLERGKYPKVFFAYVMRSGPLLWHSKAESPTMRIYWGVGEWLREGCRFDENISIIAHHITALMCPEETSQKRNILFNNDSDASFCEECNSKVCDVGSNNFQEAVIVAPIIWSSLLRSESHWVKGRSFPTWSHFPNDLDHLLFTLIDVSSINNFYIEKWRQ